MRPSWVAATVRARLLVAHGVGRDHALEIGRSSSLERAIEALAGTAYGKAILGDNSLAAAQRAVAETALWQLRVLAGWLPPGAGARAGALAAWFEIANVDERLAELAGAPSHAAFDLGSLGSASQRLAFVRSPVDLRALLSASEWGDPGGDGPAAIVRGLRLAWARRAIDQLPGTESWALGAVALLLARDLVADHRPDLPSVRRLPELGSHPDEAADIPALARRLSPRAAWALADVENGGDLWIAEERWWRRVEADARRFLAHADGGLPVIVGAVALVAVDARRVAMALTSAARGGHGAMLELLDAAA